MGSQTHATVAPLAVTFSTSGGSASRTRSAPIRVTKVSRPGSRVRVEPVDQRAARRPVSCVGPSLTPIGLRIRGDELDVRAVELAGALADPDEVRRRCRTSGPVRESMRVSGALVVEQQRLVAGVELDRAERLEVDAAGRHERQRPVDVAGQQLVARRWRRCATKPWFQACTWRRSAKPPWVKARTRFSVAADRVVDPQQPLRVGRARGLGELEVVDRVAAVGRQRHAVAGLGRRCCAAWRTARPSGRP